MRTHSFAWGFFREIFMKYYFRSAIFTAAFCFSLGFYNSAKANEPEHLCYFITKSNKVVNLSNLCGIKKRKSRLKKNMNGSEVKVNTSTIQPPNFSHYPPNKIRGNQFK